MTEPFFKAEDFLDRPDNDLKVQTSEVREHLRKLARRANAKRDAELEGLRARLRDANKNLDSWNRLWDKHEGEMVQDLAAKAELTRLREENERLRADLANNTQWTSLRSALAERDRLREENERLSAALDQVINSRSIVSGKLRKIESERDRLRTLLGKAEEALQELRGNIRLWKAGGIGGQDQYAGMPPGMRIIDATLTEIDASKLLEG